MNKFKIIFYITLIFESIQILNIVFDIYIHNFGKVCISKVISVELGDGGYDIILQTSIDGKKYTFESECVQDTNFYKLGQSVKTLYYEHPFTLKIMNERRKWFFYSIGLIIGLILLIGFYSLSKTKNTTLP